MAKRKVEYCKRTDRFGKRLEKGRRKGADDKFRTVCVMSAASKLRVRKEAKKK